MNNTNLVKYGIFQDKSDIRIHVDNDNVYVFKTKEGQHLVESGKYIEKSVFTNGIETAKGYPVPKGEFKSLIEISIPDELQQKYKFQGCVNTSQKGRLAEKIAYEMIEQNLIPLTFDVNNVSSKELQMEGYDLIIDAKIRIQVKSDLGISIYGNIFIQTEECNPYDNW